MLQPTRVAVPRPFGASSAQRLRATLRTALTAAMIHGEVPRNVAAGRAVKIRGGERPKIHVWEPEQLRDFLTAIEPNRLYPLVYLAAFAGLRRGELCGLSWDDVDLDHARLVVRFQHTSVNYKVLRGKPKTRESEDAAVDLDASTVAVLRAWQTRQRKEKLAWGPAWTNPDNLIFTREDGSGWHPDTVTRTFERLVRRSRVPRTRLHDLRHLAGSLQIAAGVDIAIVSKRLRHSTIKLTSDTYGHLIGNAGRNAAEAAHELVFGPKDQRTGKRRTMRKRPA
jgi:integrase